MKTTRFTLLAGLTMALLMASPTLAQRDRGDQPQRKRRPRAQFNALNVGQYAPTFTLASLDGKTKTTLKEFRATKPVILLFGSYT